MVKMRQVYPLKIAALLNAAILVAIFTGCGWFGADEMQQEPEITLHLTQQQETVTLDFEEYVAGVVAAEMNPDWPEAALGAQAILARTYAWRKIQQGGEHERYGADASDDVTSFQAYNADEINDNVRQAVNDTRGVMVTYDGEIALTWFHAASGGQTACPQEGLEFDDEPTPYIRSVQEVQGADLREWSETFDQSEVISALDELGYNVDQITQLQVAERGDSGRATRLQVNQTQVPAASFRVTLDSTRMKSTLLEEVEVGEDGSVSMSGKGYGHGVGLSQEGAKAMGERGRNAEEIVNYYYHNITLEKKWE